MSSISAQSDAKLIALLINISSQINRYFSMFIFVFGLLGNILNIIILSNRSIRHIPCIFLFLMASIASLISISLGLVTRMLAGWATDPTYTIDWVCKLRTSIVFTSRSVVFWLFVLATIDRWLSSSVLNQHRQLSSTKNARRGTLVIIITSMIVFAQLFDCYQANLVNTPFRCYARSLPCQIVTDLTFALFTTILPLVLMLSFSLMTISNIRRSRRRTFHTSNPRSSLDHHHQQQQRSRKTERQLLWMVLIQTAVLGMLTLPQAIQRLHTAFVGSSHSQLQKTIDMFIYNIFLLLTYLASAMPFYIYTLAGGNLFRQPLLTIFEQMYRFISCRQ